MRRPLRKHLQVNHRRPRMLTRDCRTRCSDRHQAILAQTLSELPDVRGNLIHDLQTAVLMREHGIVPICTRNTDFHRFPFLEVVDPLR